MVAVMDKFLKNFNISLDGKLSQPLFMNLFFLRIGGFWPNGDRYNTIPYKIYAIFVIFIILFLDVGLQIYTIQFIYDDFKTLASILYVVLEKLVADIKLAFFAWKISEIKRLFKEVDRELFQPKTATHLTIMQKSINVWKYLLWIFFGDVIITIILWAIFPILDGISKEGRLPFICWYPYDSTKSPLYEITYIYQIISVSYCAVCNSLLDFLLIYSMLCTAMQCKILSNDLENIYKITEERLIENREFMANSSNESVQELIYNNLNTTLVDLINYHKEIEKFAAASNAIIDPTVFVQFVATILALVMSMIQLTILQPFSTEFFMVICYQNAILVQILNYCWFGHEVSITSENISRAAYESDWVEAPIEFKKNILFFMVKTQHPIEYKALRFFVLSIATFSGIVRSSWSYFAVLRQKNQSTRN